MSSARHINLAPRAHVSPWLRSIFAAYNRRYLRRHFHSLRILRDGLPNLNGGPVLIYLNHAAWWDPLVCLLLSRELFANRQSFAPIDVRMLARYRFFKRLGFFGIEPRGARGALTLVRTARAILASPDNLLWITPQGRFVDARERPLRLESGIGTIASHSTGVTFLPLAIEYSFWTESRPEILLSFGDPVVTGSYPGRAPDDWTELFARSLEAAQNKLASRSQQRDPGDWLILNQGLSGTNIFYDFWRRLRAIAQGEKFSTTHQPEWIK